MVTVVDLITIQYCYLSGDNHLRRKLAIESNKCPTEAKLTNRYHQFSPHLHQERALFTQVGESVIIPGVRAFLSTEPSPSL